MTIAFDVDGVLAEFDKAFQQRIIDVTGKNLFLPGDDENPPHWDWPELRGYTRQDMRAVWKSIVTDTEFWFDLGRTSGACDLELVINAIQEFNTVYFITARNGKRVKEQTEDWLMVVLGIKPVVHIRKDKGTACRELNVDAYIDDKWENVLDVCEQSPTTRTYLLNRNYNQADDAQYQQYGYVRVDSVQEMLNRELPNM